MVADRLILAVLIAVTAWSTVRLSFVRAELRTLMGHDPFEYGWQSHVFRTIRGRRSPYGVFNFMEEYRRLTGRSLTSRFIPHVAYFRDGSTEFVIPFDPFDPCRLCESLARQRLHIAEADARARKSAELFGDLP